MFWFLLVGCFVIGWVQQTARREASRAGRYYKPPAAPPSQHHAGTQPRKIILPDTYNA